MKTLKLIGLMIVTALPFTATADVALLKSKGCMTCHQVERKVVGPAFKDVAKEYNNNKKAKERFEDVIANGSKGKWGAIPMPAQPTLTSAEIETIFNWIVKQ